MPPHGPGLLGEQGYADIIVYVLREAGVLAGFEELRPDEEELRALVILPQLTDEARPELEELVLRLRQALRGENQQGDLRYRGLLVREEWPDDPGAAPIGPPGPIDAAIDPEPAFELEAENAGVDAADEDQDDDEDDDEDDDGGAMAAAPSIPVLGAA